MEPGVSSLIEDVSITALASRPPETQGCKPELRLKPEGRRFGPGPGPPGGVVSWRSMDMVPSNWVAALQIRSLSGYSIGNDRRHTRHRRGITGKAAYSVPSYSVAFTLASVATDRVTDFLRFGECICSENAKSAQRPRPAQPHPRPPTSTTRNEDQQTAQSTDRGLDFVLGLPATRSDPPPWAASLQDCVAVYH
jgi:hypothetical protein